MLLFAFDVIEIPLHGRIAAGTPIEALQGSEGFAVPAALLGPGEHYALEISGDSMIEEGILDGDFALIRKVDTARDGEIVGEGWHAVAGGPHAEVVALGAAGELAEKLKGYTNKYMGENAWYQVALQPLLDIRLHSHLRSEAEANGSPAILLTFGGIGFIILIIASINFTTLSTARAARRARRLLVAVPHADRVVAGGDRTERLHAASSICSALRSTASEGPPGLAA